MTALKDHLVAARALVAEGWTQGANARAEHGNKVACSSPEAVRFCSNGALSATSPFGEDWLESVIFMEKLTNRPLSAWNDDPDRTRQDVLDLFDRAIKESET